MSSATLLPPLGNVSPLCSVSNSAISIPRNAIRSSHHLSLASFAQWNGLRHVGVGISVSKFPMNMGMKGKCKRKGVYASLFGIGAPDVLVNGVGALLVFGPKGLAEVARNLGKTIRAFQPTIRELQLWSLNSSACTCKAGSRFCSRNIVGRANRKDVNIVMQFSVSDHKLQALETTDSENESALMNRRNLISLASGLLGLLSTSTFAEAAGLPPEEKPKLCDDACEKELENVPMVTTESGLQYKDIKLGGGPSPPVGFQVAANYVAMVPSGQIFDSSLEKGLPYIFRVGSGQVIKGLDEGILSMKVGGKRRLYIPGPLAFPKGLSSAPGRPRVAANSAVVFDVSLEYIPGLEDE